MSVLFSMYQVCVHDVCAVVTKSAQEQHSSSTTVGTVFQALAFVPVAMVNVSVVGEQQEIEPQQQFHVQCNNQTYIVGPNIRYTKHTAVAKAVAYFSSRFLTFVFSLRTALYMPFERLRSPFSTSDVPGTSYYPHPRRGTLYINTFSLKK